jgi:hypothetical protein
MPRRAPRSRHRSTKLSARGLLTPQWAGLVDQAAAASGAPPPADGLGVTAPLPARAGSPAHSSEAPSVSSIDASPPPRRCATRAPRREEDGGGRPPRAQQAFHASAGIVKGGESFAENSDPWVASDGGRQQSYPVSRPLAHRLHSSHQARFEAALMSWRIVGRLRWVGGRHGDAERGAPHGEVARQSYVKGVRYRLGPRESLPCWIGGGRMHLLDEITHPTRDR